MKNLTRSLASLALALASTVAFAQTAEKPVFSHDKAVEAATYLARQKTFAVECPFSDSSKATIERLHAVALPLLGLTSDELKTIDADAQASARELIQGDSVKDISCPLLEAALRRQTGQGPLAPTK